MHIYRFELKKQLPDTLIWTGVIAAVAALMIFGFYPIFGDSRQVIEEMLSSFPAGFAEAFGFDLDDIFSYQSFSGMLYLYVSLLGAIMISGSSVSVFAREKRNKCSDFILTKSQTRSEIFIQKLLCCLTSLLPVNILYSAVWFAGYFYFEQGDITLQAFLIAVCPFLTQLVFLSIGMFVAVFLRRIRSAAGLGAAIGVFAFLLSMVYSLTEIEAFRFISPLFYFSPIAVTETGGYDVSTAITALLLIVVLAVAAYCKYTKADVEA